VKNCVAYFPNSGTQPDGGNPVTGSGMSEAANIYLSSTLPGWLDNTPNDALDMDLANSNTVLKNQGVTVPVGLDFLSRPWPQGGAQDIGAFEDQ
jgi:hypothetical protein